MRNVVWVWVGMQCCLHSLGEDPDRSCECVPVHQCNFNIPTDGSGLFDIRVNKGGCPNLVDVCCPLADIQDTHQHSCGRSHAQPLNVRITGEAEAEYGQFPWMVALLAPGRKFLCGGSLIHPRVVMTAAHCIPRAGVGGGLTIRAGEWESQSKAEPQPVQNREVQETVVHEEFNPASLFNDIALLFLDSPLKLGTNVDIVCLPEANEIMDGRKCYASGWGKDALGDEGKHAAILKSVELSIVPRDKCQHMLRQTRLSQFFRLHLSFLCAGGQEGRDTCRGDGGGPLVCPSRQDSAVYQQAGIVSWGVDCGQQVPAAYTNVAIFRSWIELQLLRHALSLQL